MRIIILFFLIFINSCEKQPEKQKDKNFWERLEIVTQFQKITVERNSDSAEVENIIWNDGIYDIPPKYIVEDTVYTKIYLSKSEKDSLKNWLLSSITNPKLTDANASDYVGNVKLNFIDRNTTLTCEYESVGK